MADETVLNNQLNNETMLNVDPAATLYNREISSSSNADATMLNTKAAEADDLTNGQTIGRYQITGQMNVHTGEADLYVCESEGVSYVLKLYRRETAVKQEIIDQLKTIDCPYVARLSDTGVYDGRPYEVMPYYRNGSLNGKKYAFKELKEIIIPELNEALKQLHDRDIIHKDLKPSNIMLQDNGRDIAIIDFGISSMKESGNTIILTKTGFTPDYTAHEAFNGLFLNESDYYSMGVTLYELYTGTTPYKNMTPEQIEIFTSVQKLPLPEDMEQDLKNLIAALTYYDITNRKDKSNPNRRWTYEEVSKWLAGEQQILPGSGAGELQKPGKDSRSMEEYTFLGAVYTDRHKLAEAFARNWAEAKNELFDGMLSARFKATDQAFAVACMDAEQAYASGINSDLIFFRILYKLDPDLDYFVWKGKQYNNLASLGKEIQDRLWHNSKPDMTMVRELLRYRVISEYLLTLDAVPDEVKSSVAAIESSYQQFHKDARQQSMNYYLLGYLLSGRKIFYKNEHEFESVEELSSYMSEILKTSYHDFEEYCSQLISDDDVLDVQLEGWLIALGKEEQIEKWKKK